MIAGFLSDQYIFVASAVFTALAFLIIGIGKGRTLNHNQVSSGLEALFIGSLAAAMAYVVGYFAQVLF